MNPDVAIDQILNWTLAAFFAVICVGFIGRMAINLYRDLRDNK